MAQFYVERVPGGRDRLIAAIAADVARQVESAPVHAALAALSIAECWTTNFDSLLEQALPAHMVIETDAALTEATRQSRPLLVKMHGSLPDRRPTAEQSMRVVITRDDFDLYQQRHPRLWSSIAAGYLSGSMLFLGLSLADPNMRLLQRLARAAQESGVDSSSVVVLKTPDDPQDRVRFDARTDDLARSGVTVLPIDSHDRILDVLRHLRGLLRPPRVILSGSINGLTDTAAERVIRAAELLGVQLARNNLTIAFGGSEVGAAAARRLAEMASILRTYDPTAITAVRRRVLNGNEYFGYPPGPGAVGMPRDGTIRFVGETPEEMRQELARLGCVVAVLGGGDGTRQEVELFAKIGLPIVLWPATGGTAADELARLDTVLEALPQNLRGPTRAALTNPDLELGAITLAELLDLIQRPFADIGPTSEADPARLS